MKKLFVIALAATMATSAFAQNPDALKQIKKAKTESDALTLVQANEKSMSAAENAQAYNKLVDIVMVPVNKANQTMQENMALEQMGQKATGTVDKNAFYSDLLKACEYALACDKYDAQPNEKGKVAPKFRKTNSDRLSLLRVHLVQAGQAAQEAEDNVAAGKYFGCYVETGNSPLFEESIAAMAKLAQDGKGDPYLSEVARVAAITMYQQGDITKALEYVDVMMKDPEKAQEGLALKMYLLQQMAKTHEDSLKCLTQLETIYQENPDNNDVFAQLAQWYQNMGMNDKQEAVIASHLVGHQDSFSAWAMQGQNQMNAKKYDDAIESFKKAVECPVEDEKQKALVNTYIGYCYNAKAIDEDKYENQIELIKQGIPYLEKARDIDPDRERTNWAYPLYQSYYNVYGENDSRTQELQKLQ